jgi:hypothetical protein
MLIFTFSVYKSSNKHFYFTFPFTSKSLFTCSLVFEGLSKKGCGIEEYEINQ